jgi:HSP20 family protein
MEVKEMADDRSMVRNEGRAMEELTHRVWPFRIQNEREDEEIGFPVDICETEDAFLLVGDLPGVRKEGLEVRLAENELVIKGRARQDLGSPETVYVREIPGADYQRSFTLSDAVDPAKISAEMKDGILKIRLPKAEHVKPREIEITG